jgi:hypothetical protein
LLIGPEQSMVCQRLQSKIATAYMALNTANVIVSLGQEYGLHFVLEVFEIQLNSRLLRARKRSKEKQKPKWNQNVRGNRTFLHGGPLMLLSVSAAITRIQQNTRPVRGLD